MLNVRGTLLQRPGRSRLYSAESPAAEDTAALCRGDCELTVNGEGNATAPAGQRQGAGATAPSPRRHLADPHLRARDFYLATSGDHNLAIDKPRLAQPAEIRGASLPSSSRQPPGFVLAAQAGVLAVPATMRPGDQFAFAWHKE
jgi:hypothetical protein